VGAGRPLDHPPGRCSCAQQVLGDPVAEAELRP